VTSNKWLKRASRRRHGFCGVAGNSPASSSRRLATPLGFLARASQEWLASGSDLLRRNEPTCGNARQVGSAAVGAHREGETNMRRVLFMLAALSSVFLMSTLSCSERACGPVQTSSLPSGRAVVDASVREDDQGHLYSLAFSFSEGGAVRLPNSEGIEPDVRVLIHFDGVGNPFGVFLSQQGDSLPFSLVGTAETLEEGRALLASTTCVSDSAEFTLLAEMVHPYEVWIVNTHDSRFGKILIVESFFCSGGEYAEVTFDWEYQPDGSRCFR